MGDNKVFCHKFKFTIFDKIVIQRVKNLNPSSTTSSNNFYEQFREIIKFYFNNNLFVENFYTCKLFRFTVLIHNSNFLLLYFLSFYLNLLFNSTIQTGNMFSKFMLSYLHALVSFQEKYIYNTIQHFPHYVGSKLELLE